MAAVEFMKCRGRVLTLTPLSGYPNKPNNFTGKINSKLGLGVYCIRLQSFQMYVGKVNVIWVKLGIGSIWETGFYIETAMPLILNM